MYGYFECPLCEKEWESAHVYQKGTGYYKQKCKDCEYYCNPNYVVPTVCKICHKQSKDCNCMDKKSDPNKPHRSDLCEKCQSGDMC